MPTIIPSYIYSLFASVLVGSIIISATAMATSNLKGQAQEQQLKTIARYVATKISETVANCADENVTTQQSLSIPSLIGTQRYWIQIMNDSLGIKVEVGLGTMPFSSDCYAYVPAEASASGQYISDSPNAFLSSYSENSNVYLTLTGGD